MADWEWGPEISQMTSHNQTISSLPSTIQPWIWEKDESPTELAF